MALDPSELEALVGDGGECVFSWSTSQGYPVGVVMAYVYRHGSFWTNCAARRKRVAALRARPQAAVVVNRDGKMASYKGDSVIHSPGDADWDQVKGWFYAALSGAERDPDNPIARRLQAFLDGPHQVIIETPANLVVSFETLESSAPSPSGQWGSRQARSSAPPVSPSAGRVTGPTVSLAGFIVP
jgi:hypothetical protein